MADDVVGKPVARIRSGFDRHDLNLAQPLPDHQAALNLPVPNAGVTLMIVVTISGVRSVAPAPRLVPDRRSSFLRCNQWVAWCNHQFHAKYCRRLAQAASGLICKRW